MKRSEINKYILEAVDFFKEHNFYLPKFAHWTLKEWKQQTENIREIIDYGLGWDISDYGSGDFLKIGLIHFTIRNGTPKGVKKGGKQYCEKIMIMQEGQQGIMHLHFSKMEDIINRGGGILKIQLYNATDSNELADTQVIVSIDGVRYELSPGAIVSLENGDSITIIPKLFHKFWVEKGTGKVLIGEVSTINDDYKDNYYMDKLERFPNIDEDEEPLYLICGDYEKYLQ